MIDASHTHPDLRWQPLMALLLLALLFAQLLAAATQLSATIDEGFHITSGHEYLRTGQMRLLDEHTPLVKALMAWPLLLVPDLTPPEQAPGWVEGDLISVAQETTLAYRPIGRVIVACRIPVALLTLLLAATVYRWAADWFGPTAGVFALTLLTFDPNVLAHGSLATTDLGATAFIFWAVWASARYLRRPRAGRWWAAALLLGLAQGAKLTAALLLPVLGLLALADAWLKEAENRPLALARSALSYSGMVAVAGLMVWALYLFEVRPLPELSSGALPAASHVERWLRLQDNISYGRESFLLGQNKMHGWWQYFPVALALKTPLPTLLFAALALVTFAFGRRRRASDELTLALFPLTYFTLSLTSTINIGYRHLLPLLPFLFIWVGRIGEWANGRITHYGLRCTLRFTHYALLIWYIIGTARLSPHYLAYFNLIAGGPDEGYRFLADSNTDWGQGLYDLGEYQRRHDLETVKLSLFTFLDPAAFGVDYEPIAPMRGAPPVLPSRFNPQPGLYAISATTLDGVPLPLPSTFDWFRHRAPIAKLAHVLFLYRVKDGGGGWAAQCTTPSPPLTTPALAAGFGSDSLRQIYFDCEQSWVFPNGGASNGWYIRATPGIDELHWPTHSEHLERWPDWMRSLPTGALHLSYVQPTPGESPAFTIWEWEGSPMTPPAITPDGKVTLDETLTFLGYDAPRSARRGTSVDVLTYWRVVTRPARPLSLMLHLTDEVGAPVAVGDGLGVAVDQWQPGDVIVQRHTLAIPADTPPATYQIRSGVYWLDDMTRLTTTSGEIDVLFASIEVER